ncbi:hypothetical protein SCUCBS95973_008961 [Sporothrix curviconia]|uniref:Luciferase-like domain-containing protein n=1 Tax=Sporothrix curviconia TaxID=1260050 RepID=A0ABP0CQW0_9PEZI
MAEQTTALTDSPTNGSSNGSTHDLGNGKTRIFLNAFDMSTVGHLSIGQWKNPKDRSATKRKLSYWIELAKILERGDITALFLADTYGGYDVYGGSIDECIRRAAQWPMTDPNIPITAMASVTKNLGFGITASTSFEPPYLLAKRFSTLDHLTDGRVAWNIVTSWKRSAFQAIGIDTVIEHDLRYEQADEYLRIVYKLWEGSWADDAVAPDPENDSYIDPDKVRTINHDGRFFRLHAKHIVDPSPQRTPFVFQAGTSTAGSAFAATHAEAVFVSGQTPQQLRPKVDRIRKQAAAAGRDPRSIKFFTTLTPIIGRTDAEAEAKLAEARHYASTIGGLVLVSGFTGIDLSQLPLDKELTRDDSKVPNGVFSMLDSLLPPSSATVLEADRPKWTPRKLAEKAAIGTLGPLAVGSPATVADTLETWVREADIDGFNLSYVTTPGTFEDVVDLLVPELRRRGIYPPAPAAAAATATGDGAATEDAPALTLRERVYGAGHSRLLDDHTGSRYKYDVYKEDAPYVAEDEAVGQNGETNGTNGTQATVAAASG